MALHAVDDLTDAFETTKEFLLPFDWGTWLRLALLSLFVAGGSGGFSFPGNGAQYTMDGGGAPGNADAAIGQWVQAHLALILGVIALLVLIGLVFAWAAAVFEFAFYESLREREVHVREYFGRHTGAGTRLFAFRVVFGLLIAVAVGLVALVALAPVIFGTDPTYLLGLVVLIPVFIVVGILASIAYTFTSAFVVPIMMAEDRGVLSGWGRLWGLIKGDWAQFAVFVVVGLFLSIGTGILVGIAVAVLGILVAIPFGLIFAALLIGGAGAFNVVVLVVLGVPLALLLLLVGALVQVPVQTYLRYYALLVLGDVDEDLDLIPDQRAAVRTNQSA